MSQTLNAAANQVGKPASAEEYHAMAVADVIGKLGTNLETGLSTDDANARLAQYGANVLPKAKGDTAWTLLWRQINSPLIWVLIASGFVAMLVDPTDGIKNGLVILAVVVLNTLIGFVQEFKAGKAIEALSKMVPENVTALRDGKKATVAGAEAEVRSFERDLEKSIIRSPVDGVVLARSIEVGVFLPEVAERGAVVAGIAHSVAVQVLLEAVGDARMWGRGAVVAEVRDAARGRRGR